MAEVIVTPAELTAENPRIYNAWLWMRALMKKARGGFTSGVYKVRVTITNLANSTGALAAAAGTQIALATRSGWDGAAKAVTSAGGLLAKGVVQVGRAASWVVDKIGKGFSWIVGLFSKRAGDNLRAGNEQFTAWRQQALSGSFAKIDQAVFKVRAAVTSKTASIMGRSAAGVLGFAGLANLATKGAVAAKVAAYLGPKAAMLLGPVGLLATAAVGLFGGIFTWLFKRHEVQARAFEMYTASNVTVTTAEKVEPVTWITEPLVDLTHEDGQPRIATDDADTLDNKAKATIAAMAQELADNGKAVKPDPKEVTNAVVAESLRQSGETPSNKPLSPYVYSKNQMDTRRGLLKAGTHPMPAVTEPVSA